MILLALCVSALMLAPLFLYIVGKIKDPFHPLIFVGAVAYLVNPHRLLAHPDAALTLLPAAVYIPYLWVCAISMLGIYVGWFWAGKSKKTKRILLRSTPVYNYRSWAFVGLFFAIIGVVVHFTSIDNWQTLSGWYRDLQMVWITAAILFVQYFCLAKTPYRPLSIVGLLIAIVPPIERFIVYGQRGDTFRLAAIAAVFYFAWNRRPSKPVFLVTGFSLLVVLATLQLTRGMVEDGEAPNRVAALLEVIPKFFSDKDMTHASGGDEFIYGAAGIETVRDTGQYGWGTGITIGFFDHLLPRFAFVDKDYFIIQHFGFDHDVIQSLTGVLPTVGSAPGGFPHGFYELGWFCPLVWIILGYIYRILWDRMKQSPDPMYQGLLVGYTMAMLYAITQDILTAEVNMMYSFLPMFLVYKLTRVSTSKIIYELPLTLEAS